jgi:phage/plasmid-associated DNA primase
MYTEKERADMEALIEANKKRDMEALHQWIADCVELNAGWNSGVAASRLYDSYSAWCRNRQVRPWSLARWGKSMSLAIAKRKSYGTILYLGVRLKSEV